MLRKWIPSGVYWSRDYCRMVSPVLPWGHVTRRHTELSKTCSVSSSVLLAVAKILMILTTGPLLLTRFKFKWISKYIHCEVADKITHPFRVGWVDNSSHTFLGVWLLIHVGAKLNLSSKRGPCCTWINSRNIKIYTYLHFLLKLRK